MSTQRNTAWFALAVQRCCIDLGLRIIDIPDAGGPSIPTMYKIKSGTGSLSPAALTRLEHSLGWDPGSATRALGPYIRSMQDVLDAVGYDEQPPPNASRHALQLAPASGFPDWTAKSDDLSPTGRRQQLRAVRTRATLIAAAANEFTSHGYAAASLNTILDVADCSKGAMYFHFSCKAELADCVLTDAEQLYTAIAGRWRTADSAHPLDAIACLIDDIADAYTHYRVIQAETSVVLEPRFRSRRPSRIWETAVQELAQMAVDIDSLRAEFTPGQLARALTAAIAGHCYTYRAVAGAADGGGGEGLKTRLTESVEIVYAAMATPQYLHPANTRVQSVAL